MSTAIAILGGVGLFLLGMTVMTDGLKAMAGAALPSMAAPGAAADAAGHGASRPDFSGDWVLDAAASDDPREKSREAWRDGAARHFHGRRGFRRPTRFLPPRV